MREHDFLSNGVSEDIARIDGISRTNTHMAFRCHSKQNMEKMWVSYLGE